MLHKIVMLGGVRANQECLNKIKLGSTEKGAVVLTMLKLDLISMDK